MNVVPASAGIEEVQCVIVRWHVTLYNPRECDMWSWRMWLNLDARCVLVLTVYSGKLTTQLKIGVVFLVDHGDGSLVVWEVTGTKVQHAKGVTPGSLDFGSKESAKSCHVSTWGSIRDLHQWSFELVDFMTWRVFLYLFENVRMVLRRNDHLCVIRNVSSKVLISSQFFFWLTRSNAKL